MNKRLRLAALEAIEFVAGRRGAASPWPTARRASRVLVVRPDHLGDLLLLTPALRCLRDSLPGARITALIGPWGAPVLRDNPCVDDVLTWDFPWFNRRPQPSLAANARSLIALSRELARRQFDAALVMRFDFWWGALACALARIPVRVGYETPETRPFLTWARPHGGRQHEAERNLDLVRAFVGFAGSGDAGNTPLEFTVPTEDEHEADRLLAAHGIAPGDRIVAIHPGAGAWPKLWTAHNFAVVADALAERLGGRIVVTGSADEQPLAQEIATRTGGELVVLAGRTSLGVLGALFRRAVVVVGVDSGPMHLAVAVGAPSVHLFGPIDPQLFGPYGDRRRHVVLRSGMVCSPCDRLDWPIEDFDAHPCVRRISADAVVAAALRVASAGGHAPLGGRG